MLYIELKRRFNGGNNGRIILSHRDAALALGVHRNTVGPWFEALQEHGFIRMTRAPCLGPPGIGQTSHRALEELPTDDMKPAPKAFMAWRQKQKPRTKKQDRVSLKKCIEGKECGFRQLNRPENCDAWRYLELPSVTKIRTYLHLAKGRRLSGTT